MRMALWAADAYSNGMILLLSMLFACTPNDILINRIAPEKVTSSRWLRSLYNFIHTNKPFSRANETRPSSPHLRPTFEERCVFVCYSEVLLYTVQGLNTIENNDSILDRENGSEEKRNLCHLHIVFSYTQTAGRLNKYTHHKHKRIW